MQKQFSLYLNDFNINFEFYRKITLNSDYGICYTVYTLFPGTVQTQLYALHFSLFVAK